MAVDLTVQGRTWLFEPGTITAPTRVLHGEADPWVLVAHGRHTADLIPDAIFVVLAGHGHVSVFGEIPQLCADLVPRQRDSNDERRGHRAVAHERHGTGRSNQIQASVQSEVIEAHLRRIEEVNPSINAVTIVLAEQALEAKGSRPRGRRGGDLPPLHGVPFTIKGNIDLVGTPTTQGLKALAEAYRTSGRPSRRAAAGCRGDPDRPHQPGHLRGSLAL